MLIHRCYILLNPVIYRLLSTPVKILPVVFCFECDRELFCTSGQAYTTCLKSMSLTLFAPNMDPNCSRPIIGPTKIKKKKKLTIVAVLKQTGALVLVQARISLPGVKRLHRYFDIGV